MSRGKDQNDATFRVGDIFPASADDRVEILRFLMATRTLVCIGQINARLDGRPENEESKSYLMFLSLGAAAEAGKIFVEADRKGYFERIDAGCEAEPRERLQRIRVVAEDPVFREFITFGRNKVSFHWDKKEIQGALKAVEDERIAEMVSYGGTGSFLDTRVPVAAATVVKVLQRQAGGQNKLDRLLNAIAQLQGDLFHVAQAAYSYLLLESRSEASE